MKLTDFDNTGSFTKLHEISLSDWVICGDHYPTVSIYQKNDTQQWFQVSLEHRKFRQTSQTENHMLFYHMANGKI